MAREYGCNIAFKPFKQIKVPPGANPTAKDINDVQFNIGQALGQLLGKDQLDVAVVQNISLKSGLNKVSHTLGRNLNGWIVVRPRQGYAWLWEDIEGNPSPNLLAYIYSAAPCTVDFWFY